MKVYYDHSKHSVASVVIGGFSMFIWIVPMVSVFTSLLAIFLGIKGYESEMKNLSKIGISLGVVGLILTIIRSGILGGII